ncbi:WecB/TagA/CpsF family glycosyltransferase [Neiella marina]|uniref:WecB/TagA/CpsF family glycosyltransferase n=1 Tax=Neiella holothuriorum TaxID=2870530 RepID=A0ABS7EGX3_9GAMM|nr:WecB/TagA/CpsF family glycosyltransferase [Neiella holothuriorum]MBW8191450.1 WecB/TagA/CpsF family glycosyltransferase [Neiella holothuriorum]
MHIIHVVRQFYPAIGGLENFVRSLASEQIKQGHQVKVVTLDQVFHQQTSLRDNEMLDGIHIRRLPFFGSYKYPITTKVSEVLENADIVHVHALDFFADFLAVSKIIHGKKLVLSTHGGFFHTEYASRLKEIYFSTITRLSLMAYSAVYACSVNDYQVFSRICGRKLQLIENGVDTHKFGHLPAHSGNHRLIFIGRFSDNKRIDKLIDLFARLVQLDKRYRLSIVGRDWDDNEQKIIEQIAALALEPYIHIHTGLDDAQVSQLVAQSTFIVSASEYEGFGLTLIEGMAAGLIPLASDIPSFGRIVEKAGVGEIIDFSIDGGADKLHNCVSQVLADHSNQRELAMNAAATYDWSHVANQFTRSYLDLLGEQYRTIQQVRVDCRPGDDIIAELDNAIEHDQGVCVGYANAHTINLARKHDEYKRLLNRFLILNDGIGVDIASKLKYGRGFSENLNGTDFTPRYLAESTKPLRIFLLGAKSQVVSRCFEIWREKYPQHQWVGFHHGYFKAHENHKICQQIKTCEANLVLVAMGNPQQEQWLSQHLPATGAAVGIGVGALFDFASGSIERAPKWLRQIRCEWVFRLYKEPARMWRRYLVGNMTFLLNACGDR